MTPAIRDTPGPNIAQAGNAATPAPKEGGRPAARQVAEEFGLQLSGPHSLGVVNRVIRAAVEQYVLLRERRPEDASRLAAAVNEVMRLDNRPGTFEQSVSRVHPDVVHPQSVPGRQPNFQFDPGPELLPAGIPTKSFPEAFQPGAQPKTDQAQPPAPAGEASPSVPAPDAPKPPFGLEVEPGVAGWINPAGPIGRGYNTTAVTGLTLTSFNGPDSELPSSSPLWSNPVTVKQNGQTFVQATAGWGFSGIDPNAEDPFFRGGGAANVVAATKVNGVNLTGRFGFKVNPDQKLTEFFAAGRADLNLPFAQGARIRGGVFGNDGRTLGLFQTFANEWNFGGLTIPGGDIRLAASNVVIAPGERPLPGRFNLSAEGRLGQRLPDPELPLSFTTKIATPLIAGVGFSQVHSSAFSHTDSIWARLGYAWPNGSYLTATGTVDTKHVDGAEPATSYSAALRGFVRLAGKPDSLPPSGTDGTTSGATASLLRGVGDGAGLIPAFTWSQSPGKEGVFDAQAKVVKWWSEAPGSLFSGPGAVVANVGYNTGTNAFTAKADFSQRIFDLGPSDRFDIYLRAGAGVKIDPSGTSGSTEIGGGVFLDKAGKVAMEALWTRDFGAAPDNRALVRTTFRF